MKFSSRIRSKISLPKQYLFILLTLSLIPGSAFAQSVSIGTGSYSTSLPSGEVGPKLFSGASATPKVSASFDQPIQTNDYWSSLIYPFFGNSHSNIIYAHPLDLKAVDSGLQIGYTTDHIFVANDFLYPFSPQFTIGVSGLSASKTVTHQYGDWTVTALWEDGTRSMEATMGHGLPYVFFKISGGNAIIAPEQTPQIWYNQNEVMGISINGRHYGIFAPSGATWSGTSTIQSDLNAKDYLSIALLPDTTPETLELYREHAYAFVTNSKVEWQYNETSAEISSTYSYETVLQDSSIGNSDETLTALYRHQWLNTISPLTNFVYQSPRGVMKVAAGNTFTTRTKFSGILPALPDRGDYNKTDLLNYVQSVATESISTGPSYENGKAMARFAHLVHIADQLGASEARDHFLSQLKIRLEDWFTAGGSQEYSYNENWDVLTAYPSGYGADDQINDHHFHSSYAIMSAATIAQYDSSWASQENWGGMVNLIIKDANNWDRNDERFPFLRSYDAYAGHSWAAGHGDFAEGNNQESSSESMNFASALILWGEATGQDDIRDLGIYLHTTETSAVEQYWFDIDNAVFPPTYPHVAIGMVWGGKGVHATWFGADPEFIHGINILPMTSGSLYLGRHPDYILENYNEIVAENGGQPDIWQDILWEYLSLSDPSLALSLYFNDISYDPFDGESRAHTLHWLYNLKKMGHVDTTIFADISTYAVFRTQSDDLTYIAHNAGSEERLVTFSDGFSFLVPSREMIYHSTSIEDADAPIVHLQADKTSGKVPLTVAFKGSGSFDRNASQLAFYWDFGDGSISDVADVAHVFEEVGEYKVSLTVTNDLNLSAKDSLTILVKGNGTPFSGTPALVPGKIEAEHFDKGGEGVAYHDAEPQNIGLAYRPNEGVDLEGSNDGGFDVYWITAGEWLEYTFQVEETAYYNFAPYVSTVPGFGNFKLIIDNVDVSGVKPVLHTGGWQFWSPIEIKDVPLEAGVHVMHFDFDSDSDKNGWLFSLNYINVTKSLKVGIENSYNLPAEFSLNQNYPNPFNPSTSIGYSLPHSSDVSMKIYDIAGREVKTLLEGSQSPGFYQIVWNGSTDEGTLVETGVYFARIQAGNYSRVIKMVYLR